MRFFSAMLLLASGVSSPAADYSTYLGDAYPYSVTAVAVDASGNTYVTGSRTTVADFVLPNVFVSKIDPSGNVTLLATISGDGSDQANGIALDPAGNIYIVGSTTSSDFPLLHALEANRYPACSSHCPNGNGFLVKMKPDGSAIYSTLLGGTSGPSTMTAVAVDAQGNVYITGETFADDSGCTAGLPCGAVAWLKPALVPNVSAAFLAKISPAGDRVLYATRISVPGQPCVDGFCPTTTTRGVGIAVDPVGNAFIAGNTYGTGLPTTAGVLQANGIGAFVAKVNSSGAGLAYLTLLGAASQTTEGDLAAFQVRTLAYAIAVDATGNAYVSGSTWDPNFPATPGALQPTSPIPPNPNPPEPRRTSAFVAKLSPAGSAMVWASFLGGSTGSDQARTIALDSGGGVWVSGAVASADFPAPSGVSSGNEFLAEFNPSGSALLYAARFPANTVAAALAIDRGGVVHLAGGTGLASTLTPGQDSAPRIFGLTHAAGGVLAGRVAPGEVISIYGLHLGPSAPTAGSFDASGFLPTTLAGIHVTINGRLAPLLYVSDTQINAVTPFELAKLVNTGAVLRLSINGTNMPDFRLAVDPAIPEVFRLSDGRTAAAINQDGTVNSKANPAKIGSIVSIWATGVGYEPNAIDGYVGAFNQTLCCEIHDPYVVLSTPYTGAAPGLVTGIVQINFQVSRYGSFTLSADGKSSSEFSLFLTP